jgi:DNA-directed RNA polymerase, mitochondrial
MSHRQELCRQIATETGSESRRKAFKDDTSRIHGRSLATAVHYQSYDDILFEGLDQSIMSNFEHTNYVGTSLVHLKPWDPSQTVVLHDAHSAAPYRHRVSKGISGDVQEILSVLEACLHVGKMERAGVIIQRLSWINALGPEEMIRLHNEYLRVSLKNLQVNPSETGAQFLHKWFELEIRNKNLPINAETVAHMLKASLMSSSGGRQGRLIKRYMDLPDDLGLKALGMAHVFTAEELAHITQIASKFNRGAENCLLVEDTTESSANNSSTLAPENAVPEQRIVVPEVRPVLQKGLGLKSLKQALSLFSKKPPDFNADSLDDSARRQRQAQLESDAVHAAIDRWREENAQLAKIGVDTNLQTKSLGSRMWKWHAALENYLREEFARIDEAETNNPKSAKDNERCIYGPFLRILSPEKLSAVTILCCMTSLTSHGVDKGISLATVIMLIGKSVEDESITESLRKNSSKYVWQKLNDGKLGGLSRRVKGRYFGQNISDSLSKLVSGIHTEIPEGKKLKWDPQWPTGIKAKVGAFLMSALIETAKLPVVRRRLDTMEEVTQMQPAFYHAYQFKLGKKCGVILANPSLVLALKSEPVHSLLAKHLPMVAEPEPWSKFNQGGFLLHPTRMMRIKLGDKDQRYYAEAAIKNGDMEQIFKGLDILGKTSWKVNREVFDIMLEAWNSGSAIASTPAENPEFDIPPEPEASTDPNERRRWIREVRALENRRAGYHSQRCFQNFQLEIARALRDETFYFPHNVDFRGRAYPIPPYLNHMGADNCRGLLMFAEGKELGANGLRWLKIHLANVYGYDKASLSDRETFVTDNLKNIFDSATSPLRGDRWWLQAEDPWQCLAACIELRHALALPDPSKYVSHLPVHQDGTCNGLQHYAALGGDEWGARQVNLEPGDRPSDVYSAVADLVNESITSDLEGNNPYAKFLKGKITRKIVKQTVMTNVYGVTYVGAKAQVRKQLDLIYPDLPKTPTLDTGVLAAYIATKIFKALSTMFKGAHDIQYWLGDCAGRISLALMPEQIDHVEHHILSSKCPSELSLKTKIGTATVEDHLQFRSSVIWTTPLRMPIVQPYRKSKARTISTNLQHISITEPHKSDPISRRKQMQAFPPNFIHSLDATHMILSALMCDKVGLTFAAVHDSFWSHAGDIDKMNGILRDAFIRIHSENVIGRLAAEFDVRYKGGIYLAKLVPGTSAYEKIRQWRKEYNEWSDLEKVKGRRLRELILERRRVRLLNSSDPLEVERGRKMVTPGSIIEELTAENDNTTSSLSNVGIHVARCRKASIKDDSEMGVVSNVDSVDVSVDESDAASEDAEGAEVAEDSENAENAEDAEDSLLKDGPDESLGEAKGYSFMDMVVKPRRRKQINVTMSWAWLPLTFPPIPERVRI